MALRGPYIFRDSGTQSSPKQSSEVNAFKVLATPRGKMTGIPSQHVAAVCLNSQWFHKYHLRISSY